MESLVSAVATAVQFLFALLILWGGWLAFTNREPATRERRSSLAWVTITVVLGFPAPAYAKDALRAATELYEAGRYVEALEGFKSAARAGNAQAMEIVGFMYLHGSALFGPQVRHDRSEAMRWFRLAADDGREVAQHMLCTLAGVPHETIVHRHRCASTVARRH